MGKTEEDAETDTTARCTKLPLFAGSKGDAEIDQETKSKIAELKREFEKHVNYMLEEDDYSVETIVKLIRILCYLESFNCNKEKNVSVPESFFRCPLSDEIMDDPVTLASGPTYDPKEKEIQEPDPKEKAIEVAKPTGEIVDEINPNIDIGHLNMLLEKLGLSSTLPERREAASKLRLLTKFVKSFQALFGESEDAISRLLSPFSGCRDSVPPDIEENLIAAILNISINEGYIELLGGNPRVIPLLIEALKFGTNETRRNAAAALDSLSAFEPNAIIIGTSGAFKPLADLLEDGDPLAMKDAASTIFHLCLPPSNRSNAFSEGVVKVIINKIKAHKPVDDMLDIQYHTLVDDMLDILATLSSVYRALYEMADLGGVPCLLGILRDTTISDHSKENAVSTLFKIAIHVVTKRGEIEDEEKARGTISNIASRGTQTARTKAERILRWIRKL